MSHWPSISVIVPSLNHGAYLAEALDSIFQQQYPHVEVIVIDGGSTDGTTAILRRYEDRLTYWHSRPDRGQAAAINEGVCRSHGVIVTWLNADDAYVGDALWIVGRAHAELPGRGLYVGNGFRLHDDGTRTPFCRRHLALDREALTLGLDYVLQPAAFVSRRAWDAAGGLDAELSYCMDWDLFIRIADRNAAVLINEFLAMSREHPGTKTRRGGLERALEIDRVARRHSGREATPGSLYYLLETVLDVTDGAIPDPFRYHVFEGMRTIRRVFAEEWENPDGFPAVGDARDDTYLPLGSPSTGNRRRRLDTGSLPSISIVTPSWNQAPFLEKALASVATQAYPRLEWMVIDGGSTDGSVEILKSHEAEFAYWVSEPDRGPAHAINKGLSRARGEIVGWLNSDDMLAEDAIWEVASAFTADPELDMVFGNALYIDEHDEIHLADHGTHRTALYYGEIQPVEKIPLYWTYVHAVPQPTVFFRRRLLQRCGLLDESLRFIFDFELFSRFARSAKVRKLERTLALYRIHPGSKTGGEWRRFQIELYAFSRRHWPRRTSLDFYSTLRSFVAYYMKDRFGERPRGLYFRALAGLVAASAITRMGNPERWNLPRVAPATSERDPRDAVS